MPVDAGRAVDRSRGPIGILACGGVLPLEVARAARALQRGPHIVGIEGFASAEIEQFPHTWVNLGQVGRMIDSLRRAGCRDLVIAGAMQRPDLWRLKIDCGFFRAISTVLRLTRGGDDSVLRRVVGFFEARGFTVVGVHEVAPHLVATGGALGAISPTPDCDAAIGRAARLIHALGPFDVGQGVVATAGEIVAIEGVRGTDAMLSALAAGRGEAAVDGYAATTGPAVLVKLPKPGQETRVDLPTIGPETVARAVAAGLAGVAVRQGQSLVLERAEVARRADAAGVFVTGIDPPGPPAAPEPAGNEAALLPRGRRIPTASDRRDIAIGRRLLAIVAAHRAGRAAVVTREHVHGIDAGTPIVEMVAAAGGASQWGLRLLRPRIGVLVVDAAAGIGNGNVPAAIIAAAARVGLAGIAVLGAGPTAWHAPDLAAIADAGGIFLLAQVEDAA